MYQVRTDLALETREKFEEDNVEIKGVRLEKENVPGDICITRVVIETENGAKAMGKPRGTYVTLEAPNMIEEDEDYHREISKQLAKVIRQLLPGTKGRCLGFSSGSWEPGGDARCPGTKCSG